MADQIQRLIDRIGKLIPEIEKKLKNINIGISLKFQPQQALIVSLFLTLLLGIILGLIYNRTGVPNLWIIFLLMIVFGVVLYRFMISK